MRSLHKLLGRDEALYRPTHGPRIDDPKPAALIATALPAPTEIFACGDRVLAAGGGIAKAPGAYSAMTAMPPS